MLTYLQSCTIAKLTNLSVTCMLGDGDGDDGGGGAHIVETKDIFPHPISMET